VTALDAATAELLHELPDDDLAELRDAYRELLDGCDAEILRRLLARPSSGCDECGRFNAKCGDCVRLHPGSGSGVSS
jgi:hypothetical protein